MSEIDKFNYLKSLLDRTAHEAIAGLTLTSANYDEAVSILQKRFGNKQQIISRHMDILLNASPVASPNELKGLRHLYDQIESHVRGLKSLGVASESYGSLLSSVLLNKLPRELRLIISRKTTDDTWNLDHLMKKSWKRERGPQPPPPLRIQFRQGSKVETNTQQPPCYLELPILIAVIASRLIPLARARL